MKIAIAGSGGFIGQALQSRFPGEKWIRIRRDMLYGETVRLCQALEGADVVVNLAGTSIARRWTARRRGVILESREGVNRKLVASINMLEIKPAFFLTASAIGYYSNTGIHTEEAFQPGSGFLYEVVRRWEQPLEALDPQVVAAKIRIGVVLGKKGGALLTLLRVARLGILPVMGKGHQHFSFIHIGDAVDALMFILDKKTGGVYNLCAPHSTDHATFIRTLAVQTGVKFTVGVPVFLLKMAMGASHVMLTEGSRVIPGRLITEGFQFRFPGIEETLKDLVKQP